MHTIRIAIDPLLRERHGPEICWTWRLLLSSIGYAWEEVLPSDLNCDIAYTATPDSAPSAKIWIRASSPHWARPSTWRLARLTPANHFVHPHFQDDTQSEQSFMYAEGRARCDRDLVFDLFWLATGQEERHHPKNKHGYLELNETIWQRERVFRQGLASGIGAAIEQTLAQIGLPPPLPRWPLGKRAAACISHDVDYPEIIRWLEPLRVIGRQRAQGARAALDVALGRRHHWHFDSWMQLEQALGTRSAFYFVARTGSLAEYALGTPDTFYDIGSPRFQALFDQLSSAGWEIGLHGSYWAFRQPEQFAAEKRRLEAAAHQPIAGHRHHYWHLDPQDPEATLLLHEQLGFQYDASLTNDHYLGWRRSICWPYFPFHQGQRRELRTLQLPTGWMDDQLFGQREANPGDRQELLRALAAITAEQGGILLADIHEYVFDDMLFPGWARTLRELWEDLARRGDFWFETPGRVASHWIARYSTIVRASHGLAPGSYPRAHAVVSTGLHLATGA